MDAIKTYYDDIPDVIQVPVEYRHKKGEVIILIEDGEDSKKEKKSLADFFGVIPDFPERDEQGDYEERFEL